MLPDNKDFTSNLAIITMAVRKCTEADADAVAGVCVRGEPPTHQAIDLPKTAY